MDRFGLIGYPIGHSVSPALFGAAYSGRWSYDLIEGPDFGPLRERFMQDYRAVNVTAPYKEDAYRTADILSDEVRAIHASNLLVKTPEGKVKAYNSDYLGLRTLITGAGLKAGDSALVIGCGGAGKAAAAAARDLGLETSVANRTAGKAGETAQQMGVKICDFYKAQSADIIIYTLPCPVENIERFDAGVYLEASYAHPSFDREALSAKGRRYISGRMWLFQQAVDGYPIMTSEEPDVEAMKKIYGF